MAAAHPFEALAGVWRGGGAGEYPTIEHFTYTEELTVLPVPDRPLAHWRSTTKDGPTGEPRHAESGFLRATDGGVELVLAHGFGITEVALGSWDGRVLELRSTTLLGSPTAKRVDEVVRRFELHDATLRYTLAMAAVGVPLTHHLAAELRRS